MRTKIGKRIGPVPIALVAVFALAAFISAGVWLVPNGAQAQDQTVNVDAPDGTTLGMLKDGMDIGAGDRVEIDVAEAVTVNITGTFATANGNIQYTVVWDDADDETPVNVSADFAGTGTGPTSVGGSTFVLTPNEVQTKDGKSISRTATVRIEARASSGSLSPDETFEFQVTVVENPIEVNGRMVTNPDTDADTDGIQWPDGACQVHFDAATGVKTRRSVPDDGTTHIVIESEAEGLGRLISAGDCLSSEDSIEVSFTNAVPSTSTDTSVRTVVVYVTGGDSFTAVEPEVAAAGLDEMIVRVPGRSLGDNGEQTIEVTQSMADSDGIVYLIGYSSDAAMLEAARLDDTDSTTFFRNAEFVVKAVFQDPPSLEDGDGNIVSLITVKDVPRTMDDALLTIKVRDANDHAVSGFVTLTVEGGDDVVFELSNLKTHRAKLLSNGTVTSNIIGLPKTGPFKIKVTAQIGDLILEKNVIRTGDAMMVEATAYACTEDDPKDDETNVGGNGDGNVDADEFCNVEIHATPPSRCSSGGRATTRTTREGRCPT